MILHMGYIDLNFIAHSEQILIPNEIVNTITRYVLSTDPPNLYDCNFALQSEDITYGLYWPKFACSFRT